MEFLDTPGSIVPNVGQQYPLPLRNAVKSYLGLKFSDLQIQFI